MIFGETAGSSFGWSMMNVGGGVVSGTVIETRQSREQVPIGTDEQPEASMLKKVPPMTGPFGSAGRYTIRRAGLPRPL